jgi:hypothetical protein
MQVRFCLSGGAQCSCRFARFCICLYGFNYLEGNFLCKALSFHPIHQLLSCLFGCNSETPSVNTFGKAKEVKPCFFPPSQTKEVHQHGNSKSPKHLTYHVFVICACDVLVHKPHKYEYPVTGVNLHQHSPQHTVCKSPPHESRAMPLSAWAESQTCHLFS